MNEIHSYEVTTNENVLDIHDVSFSLPSSVLALMDPLEKQNHGTVML